MNTQPVNRARFTGILSFAAACHVQTTNVTAQNKALVQAGFEKWSHRTGNFFDLLADDVNWTVTGASQFAKTYTGKKQFMDELIIPLNKRLSVLIVPKVREIYAEGDTVVALWDGSAIAKDGGHYKNTYAWFMKFKGGKIVEVTAFFDTAVLVDLWKRVPAGD